MGRRVLEGSAANGLKHIHLVLALEGTQAARLQLAAATAAASVFLRFGAMLSPLLPASACCCSYGYSGGVVDI